MEAMKNHFCQKVPLMHRLIGFDEFFVFFVFEFQRKFPFQITQPFQKTKTHGKYRSGRMLALNNSDTNVFKLNKKYKTKLSGTSSDPDTYSFIKDRLDQKS